MFNMPPAGNKPERKNPRNKLKENRSRRTLRTFIEVFLITTFCLFAVIAGMALNFSRTVIAPEIPPLPTLNAEESAYPSPEDDEADLLIEGESALERFFTDDRKESFFTFLIIGLNEGTNANTIMVASYDGVNEKINLVSIPRDSLMNVTRTGRKLSSAYMAGARGGRVSGA